MQPSSAANDPMARSMKTMNYMMPIMMGVMTINLPAGLGVYWTVSNIIQAGQTIIVTKMLKSKELKLEGAKK
jgi:YidC/Oxa1 family membrane protein insertase